MERSSGILMPISALSSNYRIGTFGKAAYDFADCLARSGQKYWQVLPLGPTSYGDSPYQSFSTFAGNPYFIDLDILCESGLLAVDEVKAIDWGVSAARVDYARIYANRFGILEKAYRAGFERDKTMVEEFIEANKDWVLDYALFMALKQEFEMKLWTLWPDEAVRLRKPKRLAFYRKKLKDRVDFWIYCQYLFFTQWQDLKCYVRSLGIRIIGDIPIYVALDSVDVWANKDLFLLKEQCSPTVLAGCPPDYFSEDGQLWGNPIYDWAQHKGTGYAWWTMRIKKSLTLFDRIRIDHFRGFASYYEIPSGEVTAKFGQWKAGPGLGFFKAIEDKIGRPPIIAEDLGMLSPDVHVLLDQTGFPGMKVLQFAFDPQEQSTHLPHNYKSNCVVYTGTHDNDTSVSWLHEAEPAVRKYARDYLGLTEQEGYHWGMIRGAWESVADLAMAPLQDFLGLGKEARMNTPSTVNGNWQWRLTPGLFNEDLCQKIKKITELYNR
jgi:4-alpha-glucanotransferase